MWSFFWRELLNSTTLKKENAHRRQPLDTPQRNTEKSSIFSNSNSTNKAALPHPAFSLSSCSAWGTPASWALPVITGISKRSCSHKFDWNYRWYFLVRKLIRRFFQRFVDEFPRVSGPDLRLLLVGKWCFEFLLLEVPTQVVEQFVKLVLACGGIFSNLFWSKCNVWAIAFGHYGTNQLISLEPALSLCTRSDLSCGQDAAKR